MRRHVLVAGVVAVAMALAVPAQADVKSKQRSQIKFEGALGRMVGLFAGKIAKEGIVSTITIKGNKQLTTTDQTGELVDLDTESIYSIDFKNKSYKVKTFAEMRKEIEEARAKAQKDMGGDKAAGAEANFEVTFDVKDTGKEKALLGETCKQFIMTITVKTKGKSLEQGGGMVLTSDMWMGPAGSAAAEQVDFNRRYMAKLFGRDGETFARDLLSAMAMYPGMGEAMARMQKEAAKMQGTPYASVVTFESAMSAEQAQQQQERGGAPGLGGIAGGLGGMFGRKKKDEGAEAAAKPSAPGRSTVLTTVTELLSVESAVSPQDVAVPEGFREKK